MKKRYTIYFTILLLIFIIIIAALINFSLRGKYSFNIQQTKPSITKGLILFYNFSKVNGSKVTDLSGNGNDGNLVGGAKIKLDDSNSGRLILNGDGYVELPWHILKGLKNITVVTWVKFSPDNNSMAGWQRVFDFGANDTNYIFLSKNKTVGFSVGGNAENLSANSFTEDNKWINEAVTISTNDIVYYENGMEVGRKNNIKNKISSLSWTTGQYIGKSKFSADPLLKGEVMGFCIYNRVLSSDEIQQVMRTSISDKQAIQIEKDSLNIEGLDGITNNIALPTYNNLGVNVKWSSSNTKFLSNSGKVSRPGGNKPITVTLKAELYRGSLKDDKQFVVNILPKSVPYYTLDVNVDKPKFKISPLLIGAFFEDINHAADGGVYAELVQNRSFEFDDHLESWKFVKKSSVDNGEISTDNKNPINNNNPTYVKLIINKNGKGVGLSNNGYKGIAIKRGSKYDFSIWMRPVNNYSGEIFIELEDNNGNVISNTLDLKPNSPNWKKYEGTIIAKKSDNYANLVVYAKTKGEIDLDMISLFPQDTWKGRKYGLRKDLVQLLADMKPKFLRFPGGCIVEGSNLQNAYNWKDTIGNIEERKQNKNFWGYYQSYGLGFYEYFLLAEDIGAEPIPVLNVGMAFNGESASEDQLNEFIQNALDLIEYANGDVTTYWGKKRAESGHPAPFNLKYLEIGNEQWGDKYIQNFDKFKQAINEKYPNIKLITNSGPYADGPIFTQAWDWVKNNEKDTIVDEHYYMAPNWFLDNTNRYDNYDRNNAKVFIGEYASQSNTFRSALAEAAFLTGIEKNSDIVKMASYAPLFAKADDYQWTPDLIWFNNQSSYGTTNYYVQKIISTNTGTDLLSWNLRKFNNKKELIDNEDVYVSSSYDEVSKDVIIKIVNVSSSSKEIRINLNGVNNVESSGILQIIQSNNLDDTNSFENPKKVSIITKNLKGLAKSFIYDANKFSVSVIRVKTDNK